ncbi:MAG: hypothetical protein ACREMU_03200 [Gemmatimonadaceae bacterium]
MSVATTVQSLLSGVELTPGQLAELRAIDTQYYTRLATESGAALDRLVLTRVRGMLREDQREMFDRNRQARQSGQGREGDRSDRHR